MTLVLTLTNITMTDKQLTNKAIDIKGKKYVLVSDRVLYFNETYPNWSIATERFTQDWMEIVKATITPDCEKPTRVFITWNTSAVGRALAMMWIWVIDSIASVDEINKAENTAKTQKSYTKESVFQRAYNNTDFMKNCLDEDNFILEVKKHMELDEIQEWQLRTRYQEVTKPDNPDDLPFN